MTDEQIENLIRNELKKRNVIFYDMIGLPNHGVDPNPEDKVTPSCEKRIRSNRFQSYMGCDRMKELLCVGEYNPYNDYPRLEIPSQDLFRFWWNRCIEQHLFADEILEGIFNYFTEKMRPPEKEEEGLDLTIDFDQMSLSATDISQAT